jgi:hypothetical protein
VEGFSGLRWALALRLAAVAALGGSLLTGKEPAGADEPLGKGNKYS